MKRIPLQLEHGFEIEKRLDVIGMHLSEFSFPNLYLFRNTHKYEIIRTDEALFFISGLTYDKKRYIMPMTSPNQSVDYCHEDLKALLNAGEWQFIFPIPEEWLSCFDESKYIREYNLNDSDYLYLTEKFKTYPGKQMHKKKNLLNQFMRNYAITSMVIDDSVLGDAKNLLETWQDISPQELATSDYHQCMEALENREKLNLTGFIVFADGMPAGFILGEPLNNETFTIHFAKANTAFKGVYQYLFSQFAKDCCPDYRYINMEQDMGNEGLRKTKVSYRPNLMAHKYRISLME